MVMDSGRFSFPDCFSVREAVEKKTGGNMRREMHFSRFARVRCFTTEICEISLTTVTLSMRHSWRLPYDHQTELITFARPLTLRWHLYEISRGQRKKIRLFDLLGSQLLERDTNLTGNGGRRSPAVISAPILTEDEIILLDLVTPSRNIVLSSPRTGCILAAMTIRFLCQLSFTIDSVKMFKNLRGTVIF